MKRAALLICLMAGFLTSCHASTDASLNQTVEPVEAVVTDNSAPSGDHVADANHEAARPDDTDVKPDDNSVKPETDGDGASDMVGESASAENKAPAAPDRRMLRISENGAKPFVREGQVKAAKHVKLKITHKKSSDYLDTDVWMENNHFSPVELNHTEDGYTFEGLLDKSEYSYDYRLMTVKEPSGRETVFDFSDFGKGGGWQPFIHYATVKDNILYVALAHNTYSSSNQDTAFILALDFDGNIIWRSKTLVCRASNFVIIDDTIICGYGFTDEPDFIYTLDLHTGSVVEKIPVRSSPNYFFVQGDSLRVPTYNTDYTLSIK